MIILEDADLDKAVKIGCNPECRMPDNVLQRNDSLFSKVKDEFIQNV